MLNAPATPDHCSARRKCRLVLVTAIMSISALSASAAVTAYVPTRAGFDALDTNANTVMTTIAAPVVVRGSCNHS